MSSEDATDEVAEDPGSASTATWLPHEEEGEGEEEEEQEQEEEVEEEEDDKEALGPPARQILGGDSASSTVLDIEVDQDLVAALVRRGRRRLRDLQNEHQVTLRLDRVRGFVRVCGSESNVRAVRKQLAYLNGQKKAVGAPLWAELMRTRLLDDEALVLHIQEQTGVRIHIDRNRTEVRMFGPGDGLRLASKMLDEFADRCTQEAVAADTKQLNSSALHSLAHKYKVTFRVDDDQVVILGNTEAVQHSVAELEEYIAAPHLYPTQATDAPQGSATEQPPAPGQREDDGKPDEYEAAPKQKAHPKPAPEGGSQQARRSREQQQQQQNVPRNHRQPAAFPQPPQQQPPFAPPQPSQPQTQQPPFYPPLPQQPPPPQPLPQQTQQKQAQQPPFCPPQPWQLPPFAPPQQQQRCGRQQMQTSQQTPSCRAPEVQLEQPKRQGPQKQPAQQRQQQRQAQQWPPQHQQEQGGKTGCSNGCPPNICPCCGAGRFCVQCGHQNWDWANMNVSMYMKYYRQGVEDGMQKQVTVSQLNDILQSRLPSQNTPEPSGDLRIDDLLYTEQLRAVDPASDHLLSDHLLRTLETLGNQLLRNGGLQSSPLFGGADSQNMQQFGIGDLHESRRLRNADPRNGQQFRAGDSQSSHQSWGIPQAQSGRSGGGSSGADGGYRAVPMPYAMPREFDFQ